MDLSRMNNSIRADVGIGCCTEVRRRLKKPGPTNAARLMEKVSAYSNPSPRALQHSPFEAAHVMINIGHPVISAASVAYRQGFGAPPICVRSGGSIPVVNTFQKALGVPTVLMGFAFPNDGMHALRNFICPILTVAPQDLCRDKESRDGVWTGPL